MTEKNRRNIIIVAGVLILLALALLLYLLFGRHPAVAPAASETPTPSLPGHVLESAPARPSAQSPILQALNPAPTTSPVRTGATQVAELFAERYGSWSTQETPYRNLLDLYPVMTDRYQAEVSALVAKATANPGAAYSGTTSVKINSSLDASSATAAQVTVMLQQTKTDAQGTASSYRSLKVSLVKVGEDWKVAAAAWAD
jgi:hypothetical protein